jgi:multimeric flavodoxin WrbA
VIDDDFGKLAFQMIHSDLIIVGSPAYFSDVSSPVKALIDRTISLWHTRQLKGKNIIFVTTCAESGSEHALETLNIWAKDHEMILISTIEGKGKDVKDILKDEKTTMAIKNSVETYKNSLL